MSIQKVNRKNKGVGYRVRVRDLNGNNRGRIFRTRKEAEVFESKIISSKATGIDIFPQDGKKELLDVFIEWFEQFQNHSPKFIVELDSLWTIHILPYFGNRKIGSIKSSEIRNWLLSAETQSLSPDRRNRALKNVLVRVLDFAVDMGYISKNIARGSSGRVIQSGQKIQKVAE